MQHPVIDLLTYIPTLIGLSILLRWAVLGRDPYDLRRRSLRLELKARYVERMRPVWGEFRVRVKMAVEQLRMERERVRGEVYGGTKDCSRNT